MRISLIFIILLSLILTACAGSSQPPTPTIVLLDRSGLVAVEQGTDEAAPTATPLPLPSPTPTPTVLVATAPQTTEPAAVNPTPTAESQPQVEVVSAALNIRQGPGMAFAVLDTAQRGDVFDVVGVDRFGDWLQVALENNRQGWISAQATYSRLLGGSLDAVPIVPVDPLPQRPADDPDLEPVGSTEQGTEGGRLIFNTGSGGDLYVINLDGTGLRKLAGGVIDPVVSPDGRQVAFTRWDSAEFGAVYALDIADGRERVIVGDIRQPKSPTWSPDGEQILISFQHSGLRDPKRECRTYKIGEKVFIPENAVIEWVRQTPKNGEIKFCFTRNEDLQWYLRRVDVTSGEFEDLPSDEYAYNPTWDPQEPWRVIYDGNEGLMQFDVSTDQQWPVTKDVRDTGPVFSPDGQRLAVTYKQHDHWEVYTLDASGGDRARLTKPPILADPQYNSAAPAWSPDGEQIAFLTDRTGVWEIWVMNADGSNQRPLFAPEVQAQFDLTYAGVNERLLNWID